MKTRKAIQTLTTLFKHGYWTMTPTNYDAIELGRQALLRHHQRHQISFAELMLPLPGETSAEDSPQFRLPTRLGLLCGYHRHLTDPSYRA